MRSLGPKVLRVKPTATSYFLEYIMFIISCQCVTPSQYYVHIAFLELPSIKCRKQFAFALVLL